MGFEKKHKFITSESGVNTKEQFWYSSLSIYSYSNGDQSYLTHFTFTQKINPLKSQIYINVHQHLSIVFFVNTFPSVHFNCI